MILTEKDYYEFSSQMGGKGCVELERGGEILTFDYEITTDGYDEDDYYNGTGAHITTDVVCNITNISCVDESGKDVQCDFDENKLSSLVEQELLTI